VVELGVIDTPNNRRADIMITTSNNFSLALRAE
jgi:hypothetical protein